VTRLLASALVLVSLHPSQAPIRPLPAAVKVQLTHAGVWQAKCPVPLSRLRLLTVPYWGFDGRDHTGQLVVHEDAAVPLRRALLKLHAVRFPIRHMQLDDMYGGRTRTTATSRPASSAGRPSRRLAPAVAGRARGRTTPTGSRST
jgi:hypothetical protein